MTVSTGWIQWKGTDVCMDVYCGECDGASHIDADFTYYIRCPYCAAVFMVDPVINLVVLTDEEAIQLVQSGRLIRDAEGDPEEEDE